MQEREQHAGDADLGVLFVHGIGQQRLGNTLTTCGDPLVRWMQDWLGDDKVHLGAASLSGSEPGTPAFLDLDVDLPPADASASPGPVRWRLAESWWAEAFDTPSFRELATWVFAVLPWTLVAHFAARLARAWEGDDPRGRVVRWAARACRVAPELIAILLAVALSPLLALGVLAVAALGAFPVPKLRQLAASMGRALSLSVGDSFVLLGSPTRSRAIVHRVAQDLRWLDRSCRRVVVVAHSQGAEITHRALREAPPANLSRLVTVGSGQTKLRALDALRRSRAHWEVWVAPVGMLIVAAASWTTVERLRNDVSDDPWSIFAMLASFGLALVALGVKAAWPGPTPPDEVLDVGAEQGWLDLWASHDPVANGPVFGVGPDNAVVSSVRVSNFASIRSDHGAYWRNADEFLPAVADALARSCGRSLDRDGIRDEGVRRLGPARRRWRLGWLRALRWSGLVATALAVVASWDELASVGRRAASGTARAVSVLPFVEWEVELRTLSSSSAREVGFAAILVAAALEYAVAAGVWRWWDAADIRRFLSREAYPLWAPELVLLLATAGALVGAGVAALQVSPADLGGGPEIVLVPVMLLMLTGVLLRVGGVVAWVLKRVGLIRSGHYPPQDRELVFVLGPGTALLTGILVLAEGGAIEPNLAVFLLLVFGPPLVAVFVVPLLTSSRRVRRLLAPLGAWSYAQPVAVAAAPLLDEPKAIAALEDAAARQLATLSWLAELEVPEDAAEGAARRRAELADDAVTLAMALHSRGRTADACRLLAAFAPESVDAALALLELSVPSPSGDVETVDTLAVADVVRMLSGHAQSAPWTGRRRVHHALRAVAPPTAPTVPV